MRSEYEKLVCIEVGLEALHKLFCAARAPLPVHYVAYPRKTLVEVVVLPALLLFIAPVRRDTVFGHVVHFKGAYLNFKYLPEVGYHRGVQRLVHIALGHGDVVFNSAGHGLPLFMDFAEHFVALLRGVDYYAHGGEVVYLVERLARVLHFFVYGIEVLGSAEHFALYAALVEHLLEVFYAGLYERATLFQFLVYVGDEVFVGLGVEILEAEVLQLALHLRNTEAACKRGVNFQRLLGDTLLPFHRKEVERTHIVQSVGKLDYYYAHIVGHCHEYLAEVFYILLFVRLVVYFFKLGDAVHKGIHLLPETVYYIVLCGGRILYYVVKKGRGNGGRVQAEVDKYLRNGARVGKVGFTRGTLLIGVHLLCVFICRKEHFTLVFGIVFVNFIENVFHNTLLKIYRNGVIPYAVL